MIFSKIVDKFTSKKTSFNTDLDKRYSQFVYNKNYQKLEDKYYDEMNRIENLWSVLYNLKDYTGPNAIQYEKLCLSNIETYKKIVEYCDFYKVPHWSCVPAYKRLSMLHEKRGNYEQALQVCLDAIFIGAVNEYGDNNGKKCMGD